MATVITTDVCTIDTIIKKLMAQGFQQSYRDIQHLYWEGRRKEADGTITYLPIYIRRKWRKTAKDPGLSFTCSADTYAIIKEFL